MLLFAQPTHLASVYITEANLTLINAGLYPGTGRSERINGIVERYRSVCRRLEATVTESLTKADWNILMEWYLVGGNAGSWLSATLETNIEIMADRAGIYSLTPSATDSLPLTPLERRLIQFDPAEMAVLEEAVARRMHAMRLQLDVTVPAGDVKAARLRTGFTQEEAGARIGKSLRQWSNYEDGTASMSPADWELFEGEATDAVDAHAGMLRATATGSKPAPASARSSRSDAQSFCPLGANLD